MSLESDFIIFDVCGKKTKVYRKTITQRNKGLLYDLVSDFKEDKEFFIDENRKIFDAMLDYYRNGLLTKPKSIPTKLWYNRMDYWGLSSTYKELDFYLYFTKGEIYYFNKNSGNLVINLGNTEIGLNIYKLKEIGFGPFNIFYFHDRLFIPFGVNHKNKIIAHNITGSCYSELPDFTELKTTQSFRYANKDDIPKIKLWLYHNKNERNKELEEYFFRTLN